MIGATKPTYDIWGDTVNVASRLESSGILGRIQVTEQVAQILINRDQFEVECRGPIEVKGKGLLTTYLVITPNDTHYPAPNSAPIGCIVGGGSSMDLTQQHQLQSQRESLGAAIGVAGLCEPSLAGNEYIIGANEEFLPSDLDELMIEPPTALESEHDGDRVEQLGANGS